eukprot:GHVT01099822.1.p1 GENE.GHVT01099822.1~~GHVT01099822.1.p1  ORF type:complete len:295 (+),score=70.24 GHVT01099822.1:226-1110(+)
MFGSRRLVSREKFTMAASPWPSSSSTSSWPLFGRRSNWLAACSGTESSSSSSPSSLSSPFSRFSQSAPLPSEVRPSLLDEADWQAIEYQTLDWIRRSGYSLDASERSRFGAVGTQAALVGVASGVMAGKAARHLKILKAVPPWAASGLVGFACFSCAYHSLRRRVIKQMLFFDTPIGRVARSVYQTLVVSRGGPASITEELDFGASASSPPAAFAAAPSFAASPSSASAERLRFAGSPRTPPTAFSHDPQPLAAATDLTQPDAEPYLSRWRFRRVVLALLVFPSSPYLGLLGFS